MRICKKESSRLTFAQGTVLAHFAVFTTGITGRIAERWALT